jgi:hypothetical protein
MVFKASRAIAVGAAIGGFLLLPFSALANAPAPPKLTNGQVDALTASIALYADPLLAKVLVASTYPLEIDQAANWIRHKPKLVGQPFERALARQSWDQNVKDLVRVPYLLLMLDDRLEWTQNLGDAFLIQPGSVVASIQRLRARARAVGRLRSTDEQKVIVEHRKILVRPTLPQLVYVPAYDPRTVFGKWPYTAHPPDWWPTPPGYAWGSNVAFMTGVVVPNSFWRNAIDWHSGQVLARNDSDAENFAGHSGDVWSHDTRHRHGVPYPSPSLRDRYGHGVEPGTEAHVAYRGFDVSRPRSSPDEPAASEHNSRTTADLIETTTAKNLSGNTDALSGLGNGPHVRSFSERGNSSLAGSAERWPSN